MDGSLYLAEVPRSIVTGHRKPGAEILKAPYSCAIENWTRHKVYCNELNNL